MPPIQLLDFPIITTFHNSIIRNTTLSPSVKYKSARLAYLLYGMMLQVWDAEQISEKQKLTEQYSSQEFPKLCSLNGYANQEERIAAVSTVLEAFKYAIKHPSGIENLACQLMDVVDFNTFKPIETCIRQWIALDENQKLAPVEERFRIKQSEKERSERLFRNQPQIFNNHLRLTFATIEEAEEFRTFAQEYQPGTYAVTEVNNTYQMKISAKICNKIAPYEHYLKLESNHFHFIPEGLIICYIIDSIKQSDSTPQEKINIVSQYSDQFLQIIQKKNIPFLRVC